MKTNFIWILATLFCVLISCKEKPKPQPIVETPVPTDTIVEAPPVVKQEKKEVKRNENQKFFLIAGCYEYTENAQKKQKELAQKGYDSRIIDYFENLYLVSYNGFSSSTEALAALKEIRKEPGKKDTWLYKAEH